MYGLKQAAVLAYNNLQANLHPFGYTPVIGTVRVWQHKTRPTIFCLCVDDFGIKYHTKNDAQHLLDAIGNNYKYTTYWTGSNYCGLTLDWHYKEEYVNISLSGYIKRALERLQHIIKVSPQYSPHVHVPIQYGTKGTRQYATSPDTSPLLNPKQKNTFNPSQALSFIIAGP